ncbi:hypothetical protein J5N97_018519 [Dioscorea zingiberensis]|uniref:Retrotransposon gag domain-containing protein n=1 Tax=Dioscorea zingiberensis TaxID=325984 RepID=A0A9D5HBV2_9LILI|nr:hypothetical protein J5N97_018519 [Dioscorea zingiberensis]
MQLRKLRPQERRRLPPRRPKASPPPTRPATVEIPLEKFNAMEREIAELKQAVLTVERHMTQVATPKAVRPPRENRDELAVPPPRTRGSSPRRGRSVASSSGSSRSHCPRRRPTRAKRGYTTPPKGSVSPHPYKRRRSPARYSPRGRSPRAYSPRRCSPRRNSPRQYSPRGRSPPRLSPDYYSPRRSSPRRDRSPEWRERRGHLTDRERVMMYVPRLISLFIRAIWEAPLPDNLKVPGVKFDGTTDPFVHIEDYSSEMMVNGPTEIVMCRAFPKTLSGMASEWFRSLPRGSIASFSQLFDLFLRRFASNRRRKKNPVVLLRCKQREGEKPQGLPGSVQCGDPGRHASRIPHGGRSSHGWAPGVPLPRRSIPGCAPKPLRAHGPGPEVYRFRRVSRRQKRRSLAKGARISEGGGPCRRRPRLPTD